jgi:xanthine dehydrogenase accessory factor
LVMAQQKPMLVTYDTSDEDDAKLGMGLGCNGIIQVLIEPIEPAKIINPIQLLKKIVSKRQQSVLITLFCLEDKKDTQPGTCLLLTEDGNISGNEALLKDILIENAREALKRRQSSFKNYVTEKLCITAFIEMIKPPVALVIVGAGNDVLPLVQMAEIVGWKTTVVDGRPAYAKAERFSGSCQVVVSKPENVLNQISIDEQTVFVLMTHNYNYDLAMLGVLLSRADLVYIGMLGPHKKKQQMLLELQETGMHFSSQQLSVLHSPVGLDIGAETPEEIALSIVAEIKAVFAGKEVTPLTNSTSVIHPRSEMKIEEVSMISTP